MGLVLSCSTSQTKKNLPIPLGNTAKFHGEMEKSSFPFNSKKISLVFQAWYD